jgi:DNA primase
MAIITDTQKINFLEKFLGKKYEVDPRGENYIFPCPETNCASHNKNKLKFIVEIGSSRNHCWVCGIKGKNLSYTIKKFKKELLPEYSKIWNIQTKKYDFEEIPKEENKSIELPSDFRLIAELIESKQVTKDFQFIVDYLIKRGVTLPEMWKYKIGCSNQFPWRGGPIFPSFDPDGKLNLAIVRYTDPDKKFKYKVFGEHSSKIIYNEIDLLKNEPIVIFEGIFDLIRSGIENSTCLLGSFLSENSKLFYWLINNSSDVILCLDSDVEEKTYKIADKLSYYGLNVKITKISGDDPGSMPREELINNIKASIDYNWQNKINLKIKNIKSGSF